jgi:hypothetical protein
MSSAAKQTPQRWHTCEADGQPWTIASATEPIALANDVLADQVGRSNWKPGHPQRTANAKLIAAAPVLADMVERAIKRLDEALHGQRPGEHALKYGEALRAALRAAGRL